MVRWTGRLNEFNIQIEHRPGVANKVVDCLSRALMQAKDVDDKFINCALLTSMVINSRQQLIEEQMKYLDLTKVIKVLEDPVSMALDELGMWDNQAQSYEVTDDIFY